MSKTPGVTKTGACLCGKIKFTVEGEAATPLWCTICHCLNCKRRSGSALYTAAICPKNVRRFCVCPSVWATVCRSL